MTDNKAFETVELLQPISLMQIDGSDLMDAKDEAKVAQATAEADSVIADNSVAVNKTTDVDNNTDVKNTTDHSSEQNIHKDYSYTDNGPQKIILDPKELVGNNRESAEKQDYQKHNYAARFFIVCLIGICLLFAVLMVRSFKAVTKNTDVDSTYNPILVSEGDNTGRFIYNGASSLIQDPIYTEMYFNADEIDADLPVIINNRCIEYTSSTTRTLFFSATPTEENIGLMINVEMIDKYGNSLGNHANSSFGVAAGDEYMIPVFFDLAPDFDLNGVTYKINAQTFTERDHAMIRKIIDVNEAEKGHFFITYECDAYYNLDSYVVLYKNGKVVDILFGYGDPDGMGKAVVELYKENADYDSFKVYY